jgi:hypothetical protein
MVVTARLAAPRAPVRRRTARRSALSRCTAVSVARRHAALVDPRMRANDTQKHTHTITHTQTHRARKETNTDDDDEDPSVRPSVRPSPCE